MLISFEGFADLRFSRRVRSDFSDSLVPLEGLERLDLLSQLV